MFIEWALFAGSGIIGGFLDKLGFNPEKGFRLRWVPLLPIILVFFVVLGLGWAVHLFRKIW